ncbi:formate dehydrogenase-O major subunit [Vibrio variabilis]|uniref:Formate dehydrogenase-O major subunit n=1 Tax=Vibrio variabilis TaxID=990271 RepID=A0ABQ0J9R7_9VIBR|nr:formate dehydrogenase-O major subunit [Vibrio variabilis]
MKLTKRSDNVSKNENKLGLSRRAFMRNSSIAAGGLAAGAYTFAPGMIKKAQAESVPVDAKTEVKRTICSHCSVGCGIYAEVQNGVWTGQEPAFDHPFNAGGHCAKGAALREHGHGERRLKYPMKLEGGKWKKLSWEDAIEEIGNKVLEIRKESGPDSVYWLGSAKHSNEQAYMFRKMASLWGTNNVDHQARICHSTTVSGVANTWGYGAMTNSFNDMHNCKSMLFIGSNPAEAHPVAMQHILIAKEKNRCQIVVADPRRTRTAAKANHYCSLRPGTDVAFIWGLLWHIFANKWEDQEFIRQRVYGMDEIRAEVAKWNPEEVERVTGVSEADVYKAAKILSENRPGSIIWCMGVRNTRLVTTILAHTVYLNLHWVTSVSPAVVQTSSVDTTTYRAQLTLACYLTHYLVTMVWQTVRGSTGQKCGMSTTSGLKSDLTKTSIVARNQ